MNKKLLIILLSCIVVIFAILGTITTVSAMTIKQELSSTDVKTLLNYGEKYHQAGKNSKAIMFFNKVIAIEPKNEYGYILKALSLNPKERPDFINNVALKQLPDNSVLLFILGGSYYATEEYEKAIPVLEKAAKLTPNDKVYLTLGDCYSGIYDYPSAIKAYSNAIKLNPKLEEAYIARIKVCGNNGDWDCSLADCETLKKMHPDNYIFYFTTSVYKLNTRKLDSAMLDIDKAIELSPKEESFLYAQKAWIYLEKKDYDNAKTLLKQALKINNKDQYANELLGIMAYENQSYNSAIVAFDRGIKYAIAPNPIAWEYRAKALYKVGRVKEAIETMDKVIKYLPNDKEYKQLRENMVNNKDIN